MTLILPNRFASVAVAALLTLPMAALAQSSQAPVAATPGMEKPAATPASPLAGHPVAGKTAKERVEQRIKEMYSQLRITPAERPQWDQFAQVMRDNARDMDQVLLQRADRFQSMNAVQNMESYEQIAEQHAQHVQKLVPAFQNLYNAMSDQQKQLADEIFRANVERQAQTHRVPNG
jgi:Fe2+ transport system protein B